MLQLRKKAPQSYGPFSNAAWLVTATSELEAAVDARRVYELDTKLGQIGDLVRARRTLKDNPFVEAGYYQQERLIRALIACLDPTKVSIQRIVSPSGLTSSQADAKSRQAALKLLMDIDAINEDAASSTMPCVDDVSRAMQAIILSPHIDQATLEGYHERLVAWPSFIAKHGNEYRATLERLYVISNVDRACDEMTMGWIRGTALKQLDRVQGLSSRGTKPTSTPR